MRRRTAAAAAATTTTAALLALGVAATASPARPNATALTPDQVEVIAAVVDDTFRRAPRPGPQLVLCLDVQLDGPRAEEISPAAPPRRHAERGQASASPLAAVQGAPRALVERLTRPWRTVRSMLTCQLDPRLPKGWTRVPSTPPQLVTVHVAPLLAAGPLRIDWTEATTNNATVSNSRDCSATPRRGSWSVRCGGTWSQ